MADELKPCPFCGSTDIYETYTQDYIDSIRTPKVFCNSCKILFSIEDEDSPYTNLDQDFAWRKAKTNEAWNKRTTDSERKTGRWIRMNDSDDGFCSSCKCDMPLFREDWATWKYCATEFCPNCGAKMANWDGLEEEPEDDGK